MLTIIKRITLYASCVVKSIQELKGRTYMKKQSCRLWDPSEYSYEMAFGFIPNIVPYIHDDDEERPAVIIAPGGGYAMVSPTEGEVVADRFYEKGYQAFVLTYTVDPLMNAPLVRNTHYGEALHGGAPLVHTLHDNQPPESQPLENQPLRDISRAVRYVRRNAAQFHVDPDKLAICGFSAAGHLCCSLGEFYEAVSDPDSEYSSFSNRPDAIILSYPVISSGEFAHQDSFRNLLGRDVYDGSTAHSELLETWSLEKHVTDKMPPCFIWQTATDELVPCENSFLLAEALKKAGVPYALHIFSHGTHGMSVANKAWACSELGELYCADQLVSIAKAIDEGKLVLTDAAILEFAQNLEGNLHPHNDREADEEVAEWPECADKWLAYVFSL